MRTLPLGLVRADEMRAFDAERIQHALQHARVEVGARAGADDRIALAPAGTVDEDHAITRVRERVHIAMEVRPAARAAR